MASGEDPPDPRRRSSMTPPPTMSELRLVVLGKRLSETSRVGNLILETQAFPTEDPPHTGVQRSFIVSGHVKERHITIINAPHLLDLKLSDEEWSRGIAECVTWSEHGPHAFLLVAQPADFTEEDKNRLRFTLNTFSNDAINSCILIKSGSKSISFYKRKDHPYYRLKAEIDMRYISLKILEHDQKSVDQLFVMIEEMIKKTHRSTRETEREKKTRKKESAIDLRIILLGKNLTKTSSVGNLFLGRSAFAAQDPLHSVDLHCEMIRGFLDGRYITYINAPHLLDLNLSHGDLTRGIKECVTLSAPGPHAFLLVVQPHDFTNMDSARLRYVLSSFSDQAMKFSFLIDTESKSKDHVPGDFLNLTKDFNNLWIYEEFLKNKTNLVNELYSTIDTKVRENGGLHLTCDIFEDVQEEPDRPSGERGKETRDLPKDTKQKGTMGIMKSVRKHGITAFKDVLAEEKIKEQCTQKMNLVLCGSDGDQKTFISELLFGKKEQRVEYSSECVIRKGEVSGHLITLVEMPALHNTQLSEQEVMRQTLHCFSVCDPGVHAFIVSVPVGPITDNDKAEIEMFQRCFRSRVNGHTIFLFTNSYHTDEAAAQFVEQSSETEQLRNMCEGRYIILKKSLKPDSPKRVTSLLEQVNKFVMKEKVYSLQMYIEAQKDGVREELEHRLTEMEKTIQQLKANQQQTCTEEEAPDPRCLRIVLIGKTGNGKSASGNTILGRKKFDCSVMMTSVTKICEKGVGQFQDKPIAVVDTPGLFDTSLTNKETTEEVVKCISLSAPGPHVFIIVLSVGRITPEEMETLNLIKKMFGAEATKHTMVLFTRGDDLEGQTIEDYVHKSAHAGISKLIMECGRRFHVFNNKEKTDRTQVTELMRKIEEMIKFDRNNYFTNEMFEMAEMSIQQKQQQILKEKEEEMQAEKKAFEVKHKEELEQMKRSLEKDRELLEEERLISEHMFKEKEEALKREYEKKEEEERERRRAEDEKRAEEEKQLKAKMEKTLGEKEKELEDQKNAFLRQEAKRNEEERKRKERDRQDKECFEKEQIKTMEELKAKQNEEIQRRCEEEQMRRKEQEEEMDNWRKRMKEQENSKREIKEDLERKLHERELEWKEQIRKRDEEYNRTKERHEKEQREQEEKQERIRKKFEWEREEDQLQRETERERWKEKERMEREQREKEYKESTLKIKKEFEEMEKTRKEERERQTREDNERREEERKNLQKRRDEIERERQEEMQRREREDKIRKEREEQERDEMKKQYVEKEKEMKNKYEAEARRQAEQFNDMKDQLEKRIEELILKHQKDYDLLTSLFLSAKSQLDDTTSKFDKTISELEKLKNTSSCVLL